MPHLAPSAQTRLAALDVLRGIAILGIFFMNIPFMGNSFFWWPDYPRLLGGEGMDRATYHVLALFVDGTQRGMFEFLLGASIMMLTSGADLRGAGVGAAAFFRRYFWLFWFGIVDLFVLGWDGDILHVYALSAMLAYFLRRLPPWLMLALGLSLATGMAVDGAAKYRERQLLQATVAQAEEAVAGRQVPTAAQMQATKSWEALREAIAPSGQVLADERRAHADGVLATWNFYRAFWRDLLDDGFYYHGVLEGLATVLLGMAFFRWGIIQGWRSRRFYLGLLLLGYGFGLTARSIDLAELATYAPVPRLSWITGEAARIAVTVGNMALLHLLLSVAAGRRLLAPFEAAGRVAFSLYFSESLIGNWLLFSPLGLDLWGRYGWAKLSVIALAVSAVLSAAAWLWCRRYAMGPLEWVWRSLIHGRRQSLRGARLPAHA